MALDTSSTGMLALILVLTAASACFSGSETAMMALNRYRMMHLAKEGRRGPKKVRRLLSRTDRLLGVIPIGNNLVNFGAATVFTLVWIRAFGEA